MWFCCSPIYRKYTYDEDDDTISTPLPAHDSSIISSLAHSLTHSLTHLLTPEVYVYVYTPACVGLDKDIQSREIPTPPPPRPGRAEQNSDATPNRPWPPSSPPPPSSDRSRYYGPSTADRKGHLTSPPPSPPPPKKKKNPTCRRFVYIHNIHHLLNSYIMSSNPYPWKVSQGWLDPAGLVRAPLSSKCALRR